MWPRFAASRVPDCQATATRAASTLARMSCTRTPRTPTAAASAEVAAVAPSRVGWPRRAVGGGQQAAEERLTAGAEQQRVAQDVQPVEPGQQLPVVRRRRGEADPGVDHHLGGAYAGRTRGAQSFGELGDDRDCMSALGRARA